jgi:hypothetical protein
MHSRTPDHRLAGWTLWLAAIALFVAGAVALFHFSKQSFAFALWSASALTGFGAVLLQRPGAARILARPLWRGVSVGMAVVLAVWSGLAAATVVAYATDNWDDSAYCLSGLALRGHPTEYAASRPPIAHLVAAVFADAPQFASAALIGALLVLLGAWGVRRWGWTAAALPPALLATQNVFLERLFGFTSELPAAVLLVAAFLALSRGRFTLAGVLFACTSLARWNLAIIPVVLAGLIVWRFGWKSAGRFAGGGASVAAVFLALSFTFVEHPIAEIISGNLVPAYAWAEAGEAAPDLWSRCRFYGTHFFFLTPPAVLALGWCLRRWRSHAAGLPGEWCVRCAIPAGIAAYALAMLNVGGHFPRFMAPVVPLAVFVLADALLALPFPWRVAGACVTAAWGVWPADTALLVQTKLAHRPVFSPQFAQLVARAVPRAAEINAPVILPVSFANGQPAMVELRRTLLFHTGAREKNGGLLPERDIAAAVRAACAATSPDAWLIAPLDQRAALTGGSVLGDDGRWLLWRAGPGPAADTSSQK